MKVRKQGDEVVLTVPSIFNIKPGQDYAAVKGELGSITFIPKVENIFEDALKNNRDLRFEDEFESDSYLIGREEI